MDWQINHYKMKTQNIGSQLNKIEDLLKAQNQEPLSFEQASNYLGLSKSYLYNKIKSDSELKEEAEHYLPKRRNTLK